MSKSTTIELDLLSGMFKALSNSHRLDIFMRIVGRGKATCAPNGDGVCACVGELGKDLDIVPSTVSHHVKELNRAGLITLERKGQTVRCSVEPGTLEKLACFFTGLNENCRRK